MRLPTLVPLIVALLGIACEGTPSGPTQTTAERPALRAAAPRDPFVLRHPDPQFVDSFWRQLVFNQHERPGTLAEQGAQPLSRHLNVYIQTGLEGRRVVPEEHTDYMHRAVPELVRQITGEPYRGRVDDGLADPGDRAGWIRVEFVHKSGRASWAGCARARVGVDPGRIQISLYRNCMSARRFPDLFAHELGHAFGLYHVADGSAIMEPGGNPGTRRFSSREQYHAQLLYREVERGERYCGWPFGPSCARHEAPPSSHAGWIVD